MRIKINITLDKDVWKQLDEQNFNKSRYIEALIRKDLDQKKVNIQKVCTNEEEEKPNIQKKTPINLYSDYVIGDNKPVDLEKEFSRVMGV